MNVDTGGTPVTDGTTYMIGPFTAGFLVTLRIRATTGTYLSIPAVSETLTVRGKRYMHTLALTHSHITNIKAQLLDALFK